MTETWFSRRRAHFAPATILALLLLPCLPNCAPQPVVAGEHWAAPAVAAPVRYLGRTLAGPEEAIELQWTGSGFEAVFEGTRLVATIEDSGENIFDVEADGRTRALPLSQGIADYVLYDGAPGTHAVRLTRRTSALAAPTRILRLSGDGPLNAPAPPERRMLVIGDSISTGYGVEGDGPDCAFSYATQNGARAYGALAARELSADVHIIALDGRGLVRNWGGDPSPTMRALARLTLPSRNDAWATETFQPDAIVVNLGTNDFSGGAPPPAFSEAYRAFLSELRLQYPNAFIVAAIGPMLDGASREAAVAAIRGAAEAARERGDGKVGFVEFHTAPGPRAIGCGWHPGASTQQAMARVLVRAIRSELGW